MNRTLTAKKRIKLLLLVLIGLHVCIVARAVYVEQAHGTELRARRIRQSKKIIPLAARRGYIYDNRGATLAMDVPYTSVFAVPSMISHARDYSRNLSRPLGMRPEEIMKLLGNRKKNFVWLRRMISEETADLIREMNLKGVVLIREAKRVYPNGTTAAALIGFKGEMAEEGVAGKEGIELSFDGMLQGQNGYILLEKDRLGRNIPQSIREKKPAKHGNDVYLTIDLAVQHFAEQELEDTVRKFNARGGSAVVIEAKTGRILAMASNPSFDPNNYKAYLKTPYVLKNRVIWYMFEPGSAMKPLVVAAAIDAGVVEPFKPTVKCESVMFIGSKQIKESHWSGPARKESPKDIIVHSYNTGAARIALLLGKTRLRHAFQKYNFGRRYDLSLYGQARGLVPSEEDMRDLTVANNGFGQGISVTQLQLAMAMTAVVNGGRLMAPSIVDRIVDPQGVEVYKFEPKVIRTVVTEETSKVMRYIMNMAVEEGTGANARIPGYRVGGKTGTGQIPGPYGYKTGEYFSSFIGFAPAENPHLVVVVTIEAPRPVYYAAQVAAPAFREIMKRTLWHLDIPPSNPDGPVGF